MRRQFSGRSVTDRRLQQWIETMKEIEVRSWKVVKIITEFLF